MNVINIILADDHNILRNGFRIILNQEKDFRIVGEAEDGMECLRLVEELSTDIVLMDISMPNSLEATRKIKERCPDVKIIILGVHDTKEYVYQVLRARASGYILKKSAQRDLIKAIRTVNRGQYFLSPPISNRAIIEYILKADLFNGYDLLDRLTKREREVLGLIAEGRSNKKISERLRISVKTVEAHRSHIMKKLDIHNTANLTRFAVKQGIVSLNV